MADDSVVPLVDVSANLLIRVCRAVLLRPLIRVGGDWSATLSHSGFSRLGSGFLQGLAGITSWQGFAAALLVASVTVPEQLVGRSVVASQMFSRAMSARLGSLLVSDSTLHFKLGRLNLNLMHQQRTWSCLFAPLFAASQRQLAQVAGGSAELRSLLSAVCTLVAPLSADILSDSLPELVVTVVQALMLSCDALFGQQSDVSVVSSGSVEGVLLVSVGPLDDSSTVVSASALLSSSQIDNRSGKFNEHDLLLCHQSLGSLEGLLNQNTELFSSHTSSLISRLLTVRFIIHLPFFLCI